MAHLTAKELQSTDPKRFQQEYSKWREYAADHDWWEYMEDDFKSEMANKGISVTRIFFSISYSQGDYAAFEGFIRVDEWMAHKGYNETYPAVYLAAKDYRELAPVSDRRGGSRVNLEGSLVGNTYPTGIFKHLDREAWDELVADQFSDAGLEDEMQSDVDAECQELYTDLRGEYEYQTSEQSFIESCECNDITFELEECEA